MTGHSNSSEERSWLHSRGAANAFDRVSNTSNQVVIGTGGGGGINTPISVLGRRMQESQSQAKLNVRAVAEKGTKKSKPPISYSSDMTHGEFPSAL
jgi:hypothetical protein